MRPILAVPRQRDVWATSLIQEGQRYTAFINSAVEFVQALRDLTARTVGDTDRARFDRATIDALHALANIRIGISELVDMWSAVLATTSAPNQLTSLDRRVLPSSAAPILFGHTQLVCPLPQLQRVIQQKQAEQRQDVFDLDEASARSFKAPCFGCRKYHALQPRTTCRWTSSLRRRPHNGNVLKTLSLLL